MISAGRDFSAYLPRDAHQPLLIADSLSVMRGRPSAAYRRDDASYFPYAAEVGRVSRLPYSVVSLIIWAFRVS